MFLYSCSVIRDIYRVIVKYVAFCWPFWLNYKECPGANITPFIYTLVRPGIYLKKKVFFVFGIRGKSGAASLF